VGLGIPLIAPPTDDTPAIRRQRKCYNPHGMDIVGRYINHHSFTLLAAASIVGLAIYLFRDGIEASDFVAFGALILGLVIAYGLLQPGPSTLAQVEQVETKIGGGQPVLLEFQSPY